MRRALLLVLAGLAVASLAACGSSGTKTTPKAAHGIPIEFGLQGGNVAPFQIMISAKGKVSPVGQARITRLQLSSGTVGTLSALVRRGGISSKQCPGTLPDVASRFVKAAGRTITVHGSCEPAFEALWRRLVHAVGFD